MEIRDHIMEAIANRLDKPALERLQAEQIASLHRRVGDALPLSPRLERLVNDPASVREMDADDLIDAFATVIDQDDVLLQGELLALTVTAARLGSVLMAMRLGRKLFQELGAGAQAEESLSLN